MTAAEPEITSPGRRDGIVTSTRGEATASGRRVPLIAIIAIGLGLALAPVAFQMFSRAPGGGRMLDDFRPFMQQDVLDTFGGYIELINSAHAEVATMVLPAAAGHPAFTGSPEDFPATRKMDAEWPTIHADMGGMLSEIVDNIDNYAAVDALPPFALFPFFFLVPGVMLACIGWLALRRTRRGEAARAHLIVLVLVGVALIAAPAVFRMFGRAPLGGDMIESFVPLMTSERVTTMQASFLTIGAFEGEVRTRMLGPLRDAGVDDAALAAQFPLAAELVSVWPRIGADMAPMIGAMADNLSEFAGIAALPPFPLFPWFFVAPGVLVAALALWTLRRRDAFATT